MAIPFAAIMATIAATKAIMGAIELSRAGEIPPEMRDALELFKQQEKEGIAPNVEADMLQTGASRINRFAQGRMRHCRE